MPTYRLETDRGTFDVETDGPADEPTLARLLDEQLAGGGQESTAPEGPGFLKQAGALGLRVGGPIIGGALGAVGGPAGIVAGGAAGGAAGEAAAEALLGESISPLRVLAGGATGAIPAGPFARAGAKAVGIGAKVALGAAEGATQGALSSAVQTGIEEQRLPTLGEVGTAAAGGAVLGGALGPLTKGGPDIPRPLEPKDVGEVSDDITSAFAKKGGAFQKVPAKAGPPPVAAGHLRIYRGEIDPSAPGFDPSKANGTFFSANPEMAETYANTAAKRFGKSRVMYLDLTPEELVVMRAQNEDMEIPWDPHHEVGVGPDIASRAKPLPGAATNTAARPLRTGRAGEADAFVDRAFADQPDDAKDLLKKVYSNNPDLVAEHTRGEVPFARTEEQAAALAFDPEDVTPGMNPNAEQTLAARNLVAGLSEKAAKLGADLKVAPGDATLAGDLTKVHEDLVDAALAVRGFRAEQGRALNALKIRSNAAAGVSPGDATDPTVRFVETANRYGARKEDIVAALGRAGDDPVRRMRELVNIARPDARSTLRGLYVTNLLTGPKTFERNVVGNALRVFEDVALKPVAAAVDVVGSAVGHRPREVRFGEAPIAALAAVKSIPSAARAGFQVLRQGFTDEAAHRMAFDEGKFDIPQEFGGVLRPLNVIGRSLNATDIFFRNIAAATVRDSGAYARAYTKAAGEGLRGGALKSRVSDLMAEISTNPPKDLLAEIEDASARSVFREGSQTAQKLDALINVLPAPLKVAARITMPFIRTPANIISQGFQHTPAGFITKKGREAGRLGTHERARAALGTLLLYPLVDAAANGNLTGSASKTDAGKRDAFLAEHPENSLKIGDTWYQYSDLGPLAIPMTLVANATQEWKAGGATLSDGDVMGLTSRVGKAMAAAGSTIFDASYLSGVGEFLDAIQNPSQNGPKFLQRRLSSFVPGQGILRAAAQVESPVVRQPKGFEEQLKANLPGLQKQVLPRLDAFGDMVERGDKGARSLLIPTTKAAANDAMRAELNRLKIEVEPAKPTDSIKLTAKHKVAVDRNGDFALRQAKGLTARFYVQRAMESPVYAAADDEKREEIVMRQLKRAGTFVKERAAFVLRRGATLTTDALVPKEMTQQ